MKREAERVWRVTGEGISAGPRRYTEPFVKGPIPIRWLQRANHSQAALTVGVYLWFKRGLGEDPIVVSTSQLRTKWGLRSRRSVYRALRHLEAAGLIDVNRRKGRCARVKIRES